MSKVTKKTKPLSILPKQTETAPTDVSESKSISQSTRVLFETNASALQLSKGVTVSLSNPMKVFLNKQNEKANMAKGILTGIKATSIYSDCSEPITVSMNIFNKSDKQPDILNNQGWLHAPTKNDFGIQSTAGKDGYRNLLAIMPYEKTRTALNVYHPEDLVSDRYIQQYGGVSDENLYDGVVAFPGEQYYLVEQGHVVLDVIRRNWESLGINLEDESTFNGKYVQVPAHVFDRVIGDLQKTVLARMPFTDLSNVQARFQTKHPEQYSDVSEGKFKVCVELQLDYQFPHMNEEGPSEEE